MVNAHSLAISCAGSVGESELDGAGARLSGRPVGEVVNADPPGSRGTLRQCVHDAQDAFGVVVAVARARATVA